MKCFRCDALDFRTNYFELDCNADAFYLMTEHLSITLMKRHYENEELINVHTIIRKNYCCVD